MMANNLKIKLLNCIEMRVMLDSYANRISDKEAEEEIEFFIMEHLTGCY